jgi:lipopolysaccharide transport system ATP-binding protein
MPGVVIRCENLSKSYVIGEFDRYRTLRDVISEAAAGPFRLLTSKNGHGSNRKSTTIWALHDLNFEIEEGEVVGIIGRNGAGKSTLLKVLSRITKPTRGSATVTGRVGSLLEVGTGFHPELTGRENIYLNGAILGMRRSEIVRKFDEIVGFAEIEEFIDTPVKRYSSGMYTRLAFGVAAHLETEILVVDEVLAVGDAQFQKKCLEKMQEVGKGGRTILFVSHNMSAVRQICTRGIQLGRGAIENSGEINQVVDKYLAASEVRDSCAIETPSFVLHSVSISAQGEEVVKTFSQVEIKVAFTPKESIQDPGVYISILTNEQFRLAGLDLKDFCSCKPIKAGEYVELGFAIDALPLLAGSYQIEVHLKDMATHKVEQVPETFSFEVAATPIYGGRKLDTWFGNVGLKARPISNSL